MTNVDQVVPSVRHDNRWHLEERLIARMGLTMPLNMVLNGRRALYSIESASPKTQTSPSNIDHAPSSTQGFFYTRWINASSSLPSLLTCVAIGQLSWDRTTPRRESHAGNPLLYHEQNCPRSFMTRIIERGYSIDHLDSVADSRRRSTLTVPGSARPNSSQCDDDQIDQPKQRKRSISVILPALSRSPSP